MQKLKIRIGIDCQSINRVWNLSVSEQSAGPLVVGAGWIVFGDNSWLGIKLRQTFTDFLVEHCTCAFVFQLGKHGCRNFTVPSLLQKLRCIVHDAHRRKFA
jgi:hypothetical protein